MKQSQDPTAPAYVPVPGIVVLPHDGRTNPKPEVPDTKQLNLEEPPPCLEERVAMAAWLRELRQATSGEPEAEAALARLSREPSGGNRAARRKDTKECEKARSSLLKYLTKRGLPHLIHPPKASP